MPLWLRRTTFNLMNDHFTKQNEAADAQQQMLNNSKNNKSEISRPNIAPTPTYTTKKASK